MSSAQAGGPPHHRRVYRTSSTVSTAWGATVATVVVAGLAVLPEPAQILLIVMVALLPLVTWRAWRLGVYVEPGGVRLVQYVTTKRLAWEDIDYFAVMPSGSYPFIGHVVLRTGQRPIPIAGMGAAARPNPEGKRLQVQRPVDELNQVLAEWRQATGWTAPLHDPSLSDRTREHAAADYRTTRAVLLTFAVVVWLLVGGVAAVEPKPGAVAFAAALGVLNTLWTYLAFRQAKKTHLKTSTPPQSASEQIRR
jgi:hypothetical protein